MKKNSSSIKARVLAGIPFILAGIVLLALSTTYGANRRAKVKPAERPHLRLSPNLSVPAPFAGTYDPIVFPCGSTKHPFTVLPGQVRIIVQVSATVPTNDLTVTLLYGPTAATASVVAGPEDSGTSSEILLYQPGGIVPSAFQYYVQVCETPNPGAVPQLAPFDYNGTFTTDATGPAGGAAPPKTLDVPDAPQDNGPKIGFENFSAPGILTPVKTTEAGQQPNSVEYLGRNAGEPSIGDNWLTDTAFYVSGLQSLFVNFNDTCPANGLSSTWANRAAPTQIAVDSDPIGFTDPVTGRTFSGQLTLLSPTCKTSFTDNDGQVWVPTQGSGLASGVDHETIGGGRYHAPLDVLPPTPAYPRAVYYCSQEGQSNTGLCSLSVDGGLTFGPSVLVTPALINVCSGLHGHVKVSPKDGSVYLPFNSCDGAGSVAVSEDNGTTWTVRHVATSGIGGVSTAPSASFQDPAVSVDNNGRVYFVIGNNDTQAAVATSDDHGATWQNLLNVSDIYGLKNVRYPAAIAGNTNKAAVSFYGTTTPGDALQPGFAGVWHLYVAHTFDGGLTWTTTDATPNAPMQRGCIWAKGGANICRNLLDFFDMTVDKDGRVLVGYVNGCEGGNCVQAPLTLSGESPPGQGNGYTTTATIARQSSGRRLIGPDPVTTSKPGMPLLTQKRVGNVVTLQWSEADTGNLMINSYEIRRGTTAGGETFLASISGTQVGGTYTDVLPLNDTTTYFYKVLANNSLGASCGNNEVSAPYIGNTCTGITIHRNDPTHPEANPAALTQPSMLIDYIAVGEPPSSSNFMFKMKVNDLSTIPPNSRWRMVWDSFSSSGQQYYVGMRSDGSSNVTFQYGELKDAGVPAVFVISEQTATPALAGSNFQPDGTITILAPKSAFGSPPVGTLLGAMNGRTFTGDNAQTGTLHRSNAFMDHTFSKAQTDNGFPPATYTVLGNNSCTSGGLTAIGAVSRKTHGSAGTFDIDLPLTGQPGIECRTGGPSGNHKIVVTFPVPVTVASATCGGNPATATANGSVVTVDCTGVPNAQTINVVLSNVSDNTNTVNVSIPVGVLEGDTTANRAVNSSDIAQTQSQSGQTVNSFNFREDVTVNALINSSDISIVQSRSGTALP